MTINEMNNKIAACAPITICPWTMAYSNQCLVEVKAVAGGRAVTYAWNSGEEEIVKTAQVDYSTWNFIVESLNQ